MDKHSSENFYTYLPVLHLTLNQLLEDTKNFKPIPNDWVLVLTDIVDSTNYFKSGHYQEVNLVAVSSLSVVFNVARHADINIPFIYGGDGATLLVPPTIVDECKGRLATLRANTLKRFGMDLRVSFIPMSDVIKAGLPISVAKLNISPSYNQAIFLGDGVSYAESLMKHAPEYLLPINTEQKPINLKGLECKWKALFPPRPGDEVISLIVVPLGKIEPEEVFKNVLNKLDKFYGSFSDRHPLHPKHFSTMTHLKTMLHSSRLIHGGVSFKYMVHKIILATVKSIHLTLKIIWHKIFTGDTPDMSTSSDTLKIDNNLKTIFAGSPEYLPGLIEWLDEQEADGEFVYGISIAKASVLTCYIKDSGTAHVRFLDGFGGGYTLAAIEMKKKLAKLAGKNNKK